MSGAGQCVRQEDPVRPAGHRHLLSGGSGSQAELQRRHGLQRQLPGQSPLPGEAQDEQDWRAGGVHPGDCGLVTIKMLTKFPNL